MTPTDGPVDLVEMSDAPGPGPEPVPGGRAVTRHEVRDVHMSRALDGAGGPLHLVIVPPIPSVDAAPAAVLC